MYYNSIGPNRHLYNSLVNFAGKHIYMDNRQRTGYNNVCERHIKQLLKNVAVIVALMILSHAMLILGPLYAYFSHNIRITPLATNMPFFEKNSDIEFTINLLIQAIMIFYASAGSVAIEIVTCLILDVVTIIPDFIQISLNRLTDDVCSKVHVNIIIAHLRNTIIQIQDFDRYITQFFSS